jgi:hypothetical protein
MLRSTATAMRQITRRGQCMRFASSRRQPGFEIGFLNPADPDQGVATTPAAAPARPAPGTTAAVQQLPFFAWPGGQKPGEVAIAGTTILALGGSIVAVQADSKETARRVTRIGRMV